MSVNKAGEWFWWIWRRRDGEYSDFSQKYDMLVGCGYSKKGDRKEYKACVAECSRRRISVLIKIRGNSQVARDLAKNIRNEQTRYHGMKVDWENLSEYRACGRTRPMDDEEWDRNLDGMSGQDLQEPKFKRLIRKRGVPAKTRYTYVPKDGHSRGGKKRRGMRPRRPSSGGVKRV